MTAVVSPAYWIAAFAAQRGYRYEPEVDERWLRVWEPFATLKTPVRYEHALYWTGSRASATIARAIFEIALPAPGGAIQPTELGAWVVIGQDDRVKHRVAVTSDVGGTFAEPLDLVPLARASVDPTFDRAFAVFAADPAAALEAVSPSVRRLLLSWRSPVHLELRPGGFLLAPVSVAGDPYGLSWVADAVRLVYEKLGKYPPRPHV